MVKLLIAAPQHSFHIGGGAEIALVELVGYLKKKGVKCDFFDFSKSLKDYDLIYLHNIAQFPIEAYKIVSIANTLGLKTIVNPTYWSSLEALLECGQGIMKAAYMMAWFLLTFISKTGIDFGAESGYKYLRLALNESDRIIVNSKSEAKLISNFFSLNEEKIRVVYNGVSEDFCNSDPKYFVDTYGISDFILYVGRIDPRKNILRLIKAFKKAKLDTDLVVIGKPDPYYQSYFQKCLSEAKNSENIHFLGHLTHDSVMLKSAYAASKVFVLPSFYETPGLAAMEAALAGANVVITDRGATREYFSKYAIYVDPGDLKSIAHGLMTAYYKPRSTALRKHILNNFTWDKVSNDFLKVLEELS